MAASDCEFATCGGTTCAWAPGACKSWCRSNSTLWAPSVISILDEITDGTFLGFGIHIDALGYDTLPNVLAGATLDEHAAAIRSENLKRLGIDGIFGLGTTAGMRRDDIERRSLRCGVSLSGLTKPGADIDAHPPDEVLEAWDGWLPLPAKHGWSARHMLIQKTAADKYKLARLETPWQVGLKAGPWVTRAEAVDVVASTMGDTLPHMRMVGSRLFFTFSCLTYPWSYVRRQEFVGVMDMLARGLGTEPKEDRLVSSPQKGVWELVPLGPRTPPGLGNIHITMRRAPPAKPAEIAWGSVIHCVLKTNPDPAVEFAPLGITITTTW